MMPVSLTDFEIIRSGLLADLNAQLKAARRAYVDDIAARIREIGFSCQMCSECCCGLDNSVTVFPFEIRRIMAHTGMLWEETVQPPAEGEWDSSGNLHTLEWRLRKDGISCRFLGDQGCRIYDSRPLLCKTYPFYLEDGDLHWSECRGLGLPIDEQEAARLASGLIYRNIIEIEEAIALTSQFCNFRRGRLAEDGLCIVHDSEGEHTTALP